MNKNKLDEILNLHKLWLNDDPKGRRADLTDAILTNADLTNAILTNAKLWYADLTNADLTNAILTNADLTNADLTNADLTNADLWYATFNKETVFPDGFDPIARGMKLIEEKVEVAAVPAAPKTLHEELSEVLAKHGFDLVSLAIQPSKKHTNQG